MIKYINSPWQIVIEPTAVKVRHQDETQISHEAYTQLLNVSYVCSSSYIHIRSIPSQ
jgi:hypothetical protein